ncbi:MFS transporter [Labrys wisconsinensis]|uniref:MFS family permease n=1 Tax=Labrys wisconsinensis TaxID=425677 RepID=A0ABU0J390_9HYPH|nr:MFS transporter [Labrys wisconsinensis]MDQ0468728.1 MFS family permease [Labrys wisconsinensis]
MERQSIWRELAATGHLKTFAVICGGIWLHAADSLVTATLMPAAIGDIGGLTFINWTISLYQAGSIVTGAAAGAATQRLGLRAAFLAAMLVYGLGCLVAALAPTMALMLAGRLMQGMGGGMLLSLGYVATQALFPRHLWTRLIAMEAVIWSVAALCGPLLGALFVELGFWRGAFWMFAAQASLLMLAVAALIPGTAAEVPGGRWPWLPLLLLFAATLAVATAGEVRGTAPSLLLGGLGLGLLVLAALADRRSPDRMLPRNTLTPGHPVAAGLLMVLTISAATTGFWVYGPLILKVLFEAPPLVAGWLLAAESIAWSLGTLTVSRASAARQPGLIRLGIGLAAAGACGFLLAIPGRSLVGVSLCVLLQGAGFGVFWPFLMGRLVTNAPREEQALAASAAPNVQRIGYALGAAAAGISANSAGLAEGMTADEAVFASTWVFAVFVPLVAVACAAAWRFTAAEGPSAVEVRRPLG